MIFAASSTHLVHSPIFQAFVRLLMTSVLLCPQPICWGHTSWCQTILFINAEYGFGEPQQTQERISGFLVCHRQQPTGYPKYHSKSENEPHAGDPRINSVSCRSGQFELLLAPSTHSHTHDSRHDPFVPQLHMSQSGTNHVRSRDRRSTTPTCPFFAQPTPIKLFSSTVDRG